MFVSPAQDFCITSANAYKGDVMRFTTILNTKTRIATNTSTANTIYMKMVACTFSYASLLTATCSIPSFSALGSSRRNCASSPEPAADFDDTSETNCRKADDSATSTGPSVARLAKSDTVGFQSTSLPRLTSDLPSIL